MTEAEIQLKILLSMSTVWLMGHIPIKLAPPHGLCSGHTGSCNP